MMTEFSLLGELSLLAFFMNEIRHYLLFLFPVINDMWFFRTFVP